MKETAICECCKRKIFRDDNRPLWHDRSRSIADRCERNKWGPHRPEGECDVRRDAGRSIGGNSENFEG